MLSVLVAMDNVVQRREEGHSGTLFECVARHGVGRSLGLILGIGEV